MKWPFSKKNSSQPADRLSDPVDAMFRPGISREVFRLLYARVLEERRPGVALVMLEPFSLQFDGEDGVTYQVHLENLWIQCRQDPEQGRGYLARQLETVLRLGEPIAVNRDAVIAKVQGQGFIEILGDSPEVCFAMEHLVADFWTVFMLRSGSGYSSLTWAELEDAGVARKEVRELSFRNLWRLISPADFVQCDGYWMLTGAGDLAVCFLLSHSYWAEVERERVVEGDLLVAAPTDDLVMFTGSGSPGGIKAMRARVREAFENEDHIVSSTLLRHIDGGWKVFD